MKAGYNDLSYNISCIRFVQKSNFSSDELFWDVTITQEMCDVKTHVILHYSLILTVQRILLVLLSS